MSADPPRWSGAAGDAPSDLRALLRAGQGVGPTEAEVARVLGRLREPPQPAFLHGAGGVGAVLGGALLIGLLGAGAVMLEGRGAPNPVVEPSSEMGLDTSSSAPRGAPDELPQGSASPGPAAGTAVEAHEHSARGAESAPSGEAGVVREPGLSDKATDQASGASPPASGALRSKSGHAHPAPSALPSEASLLHGARAELASHPARAIELLERHRDLYPRGILTEERDALLIEALSRAGRTKAAEEQSEAFRAAHPSSVHRPAAPKP